MGFWVSDRETPACRTAPLQVNQMATFCIGIATNLSSTLIERIERQPASLNSLFLSSRCEAGRRLQARDEEVINVVFVFVIYVCMPALLQLNLNCSFHFMQWRPLSITIFLYELCCKGWRTNKLYSVLFSKSSFY